MLPVANDCVVSKVAVASRTVDVAVEHWNPTDKDVDVCGGNHAETNKVCVNRKQAGAWRSPTEDAKLAIRTRMERGMIGLQDEVESGHRTRARVVRYIGIVWDV